MTLLRGIGIMKLNLTGTFFFGRGKLEVVVVVVVVGKLIYQSSEVLDTYIFHRTYKWQNLLRLL